VRTGWAYRDHSAGFERLKSTTQTGIPPMAKLRHTPRPFSSPPTAAGTRQSEEPNTWLRAISDNRKLC
jgi:hypothetical protein